MALQAFTIFHVLLSLVAIVAGFVVMYGLVTHKRFDGTATIFLSTTLATVVTGFLFPFHGFTPAHGVGIVSLVILLFAILARHRFRLAGAWRRVYAVTSGLALYLNFFVLVVQLFQKVPALNAMAPTQTEPPFQVAQLVTLVFFGIMIVLATVKSRGESAAMAS